MTSYIYKESTRLISLVLIMCENIEHKSKLIYEIMYIPNPT